MPSQDVVAFDIGPEAIEVGVDLRELFNDHKEVEQPS